MDVGLMLTVEEYIQMMEDNDLRIDNGEILIPGTDFYDNYWDEEYRNYVVAFEKGLV